MQTNDVIVALKKIANPEVSAVKAKKYAIKAENMLGVYQAELKKIAHSIGTNNDLADALFDTGIYEARLLCSKIFDPKAVTPTKMNKWAKSFENWEVCDSFSMELFARCPFAIETAMSWSHDEREFIKRAAFAIMAAYGSANKKAENAVFETFLVAILRESNDPRNFVKKAVSWALRSIGKRNQDLRIQAIEVAKKIQQQNSPAARWIAADALRELTHASVKMQDHPRNIYRPRSLSSRERKI